MVDFPKYNHIYIILYIVYLAPESNTLHIPPTTDNGTKRENTTSPAVPNILYPNGCMDEELIQLSPSSKYIKQSNTSYGRINGNFCATSVMLRSNYKPLLLKEVALPASSLSSATFVYCIIIIITADNLSRHSKFTL